MANFLFPSAAASLLALSMSVTPAPAASEVSNQQKTQSGDAMNLGRMNHDRMVTKETAKVVPGLVEILPKEPGQGAFATIAEIVVMLTEDTGTDWGNVDIDRLREHLVDMDEVTLRASAKTAAYDDKVIFTVTGTGRTIRAIQAMVPAHAGVLSRTTAWGAKSEPTENGAILTISSDNPATLKMVEALGFYGVMATGSHHQAHHLAMARGDSNAHARN